MAQKFSNQGSTTIVNSISDNDTTILVLGGTGELFPLLNNADPLEFSYCTLEDQFGNFEIVKATGRVGDNFTVERGAENTTAIAFASGARFELRTTAATLDNFLQRTGDGLDGSTMDIVINHSDAAGVEPTGLQEGELYLDTATGKLYYGNNLATESLLVQQFYISSTGAPPQHAKDGALWFQTDTELLFFYYNTVWYRTSGIDNNGNIAPPITVSDVEDTYMSATTTEVSGAPGVSFMDSNVTIDRQGDVTIAGTLDVSGEATMNDIVAVDMTLSGTLNVPGGALIQHGDASLQSGRLFYFDDGTALPNPADYLTGDIVLMTSLEPVPL